MLTGLFVELFVAKAAPYRPLLVSILRLAEERRTSNVTMFHGPRGRIILHEGYWDIFPFHPFFGPLSQGARRGVGVELAIEVDDVTAAHARAKSLRGFTMTPLLRQPWGLRDFRLLSPDRYYFRITEPAGG